MDRVWQSPPAHGRARWGTHRQCCLLGCWRSTQGWRWATCGQGPCGAGDSPAIPFPQNATSCAAGPARRSRPAAAPAPPAAGRRRARPRAECDAAARSPGQGETGPCWGAAPRTGVPGVPGAAGTPARPPPGPTSVMSPSWRRSCPMPVPEPRVGPSISWERRGVSRSPTPGTADPHRSSWGPCSSCPVHGDWARPPCCPPHGATLTSCGTVSCWLRRAGGRRPWWEP